MKSVCLIPILLCSLLSVAGAKDKPAAPAPSFEPGLFDSQRRELVRELKVGSRYSEIEDQDRAQVLANLDRMAALLGGISRIDELDDSAKVEVHILQAEINTVLTGAAHWSREVCKRMVPVGTRFPQGDFQNRGGLGAHSRKQSELHPRDPASQNAHQRRRTVGVEHESRATDEQGDECAEVQYAAP